MAANVFSDSPFLAETEAARFLRVSPRTMQRWRLSGGGPVFRRHGRHVVYSKLDLVEFSESSARRSTSEAA